MLKRCAFLSCSNLDGFVHDDALTYPALRERGWAVETIAWDAPAIDWAAFDVVVIRTTWDYTARVDPFLERLREIENTGVPLLNSAALSRWNARKTYLLELQRDGVPVVPTIHSPAARDHGASLERAFRDFAGAKEYGIIAKPVVGAGSSGIVRVYVSDHAALEGRDEPLLLQPFLPSVHEGELSLVYFRDRFSHAIRKVPRTGDFRSQEEFGSNIRAETPTASLLSASEALLERLPELPLYSRFDFVPGSDGAPLLMELELIEPALYFRTAPGSCERFADALTTSAGSA